MTTPPRYVYLSVHRNYRSADEWYFVGVSDAPLRDCKRVCNSAVTRNSSRRVLWCIECVQAVDVARQVNEWLMQQPVTHAGEKVVTYLLGYEDADVVKEKARELTQKILPTGRTFAP